MNSLQTIISYLEDLFSQFNVEFFDGKLEKPIISISPEKPKKGWNTYGWCTSWKAWKKGDSDEGYYEINMCAEHLNRPFAETCCTLIHEMVHLLNLQEGVKDTSRSGLYHNKRFKETAEAHGLIVEKDAKYGFCTTTLTEYAAEYIETLDGTPFELYRPKVAKVAGKSSSSSRKYTCPMCGMIVRATKEVRIMCADCGVTMMEEF